MSVKLTSGQYGHLKALSTTTGQLAAAPGEAATAALVTYARAASVLGLPSLRPALSGLRIAEAGGDGIFLPLTYDPRGSDAETDQKKALVERIGAEAKANHLPLVLALMPPDASSEPEAVIAMTREFSDPRYSASALALPTPVPLTAITDGSSAYSRAAALTFFKAQSDATDLPYAFHIQTEAAAAGEALLNFAHESGAAFNGLIAPANVLAALTQPIAELAQPWATKVEVED